MVRKRSSGPPRIAEWILMRASTPEQRGPLLGDLAVEYWQLFEASGPLRARLWYWRQVLGSVVPLLARRISKAAREARGKEGDGQMQTFAQDLRYALRAIRKNPWFAAVVVLTLGLGIGANVVVFSTVDGVVLNPFPYPDGDRLVGVGNVFPKLGRGLQFVEALSPPEYLDIRDGSRSLQHVVAWDMGNRQLTVGEATENLFTGFWWGNAFPTLGVLPALGRGFLAEEIDRGDRVAIISHRIWRSRFGGDSTLVGGTVLMNGEPYTLVGIMPPRTLIFGTDLWIPMPVGPERIPRTGRQFNVLARLAPGTDLEDANVELQAIAGQVEQEFVAELMEYEDWQLVARTWRDINVVQFRPAAMLLLGSVAFVLLLVCANVASLLLARSSGRQRELAVRSALGAGRLRIVKQLLTESVVLATLGGVIGAGLAYVGVGVVAGALDGLPIPGDVSMNARALLFTALIALAAGIVFGLAPALQASRSGRCRCASARQGQGCARFASSRR